MTIPVAPEAPDTGRAVARGLGIGAGALALLVAGWFGFSTWRDSRNTAETSQAVGAETAAPVAAAQTPQTPHERARVQLAAGRIAQPAGDNAAETYLAILAADPRDSSARQALTELLPLINDVASAAADTGQIEELQRLIGLIEQADSGHAQLTALRQRVLDLQRAAELAAQVAAAPPVHSAPMTPPAPAIPAPPPTAAAVAASTTRPATAPSAARPLSDPPPTAATPGSQPGAMAPAREPVPTVATASIAPQPQRSAQIVEPVLVGRVDARYPSEALARRLEGWVEVELSVDARGATSDARVVAAEPNHPAFKREALRAVSRWRFEPKTVDGVPTTAKLRRRVNFRMPG